jgi:hypothetical protein
LIGGWVLLALIGNVLSFAVAIAGGLLSRILAL